MGRPLKNLFFNPDNTSGQNYDGAASTEGGEGVSTLSFSNRGATYYSANVAITLGAPTLPGGTQSTVSSITLFGNGAINSYTIASGSGYLTAPAVTITGANATPAVATSTLNASTTSANAIAIRAWVTGGASSIAGDIVKQTGAKSFRVATTQGTSKCTLTTGSVAEGQCQITATKADASTFYVANINGHTVTDSSGVKFLWSINGADGSTTPETVNIGTN